MTIVLIFVLIAIYFYIRSKTKLNKTMRRNMKRAGRRHRR